MRLASYRAAGKDGYGLVRDDGIVDLGSRLADCPDLLALLRADGLDRVAGAVDGAGPDHRLADVELLPPVTDPEKIICVGVNYANRDAEYTDGRQQTSYPNLFVRFPRTFVGHDQPLIRPKASDQLDYEGELTLVIGTTGRHIAEADALDHVAGLTLANEGSVRDWMRHGSINVTQGKNFEASGSIGPWLVTADEIDFDQPLSIVTRVNGEVRQNDTTASIIHTFESLIAYISTFVTLVPGDLILTGTPTGAGARLNPPVWLKPGDIVEVENDAVGVLRNGIADEQ